MEVCIASLEIFSHYFLVKNRISWFINPTIRYILNGNKISIKKGCVQAHNLPRIPNMQEVETTKDLLGKDWIEKVRQTQ